MEWLLSIMYLCLDMPPVESLVFFFLTLHHRAENIFLFLPHRILSHLWCRLPLVLLADWRFWGQWLSPESRLPLFALTKRGSQTVRQSAGIAFSFPDIISVVSLWGLAESLKEFVRRHYKFVCRGHTACYHSSVVLCVSKQHDCTFHLFDRVSFEWVCISAVWKCVSRIHWHPELNVKVPWSKIVQTNFHWNDLYAAGIRMKCLSKAFCIHLVSPQYFCIEPLHFESPA